METEHLRDSACLTGLAPSATLTEGVGEWCTHGYIVTLLLNSNFVCSPVPVASLLFLPSPQFSVLLSKYDFSCCLTPVTQVSLPQLPPPPSPWFLRQGLAV